MTLPDLALVAAGIVAHKLWRVAWRLRPPRSRFLRAVRDEFAPGDEPDRKRRERPPSVTEVA